MKKQRVFTTYRRGEAANRRGFTKYPQVTFQAEGILLNPHKKQRGFIKCLHAGKLPSRGDLLNIHGEIPKRRRFIRRG